jgi:hypothetical protein
MTDQPSPQARREDEDQKLTHTEMLCVNMLGHYATSKRTENLKPSEIWPHLEVFFTKNEVDRAWARVCGHELPSKEEKP